MIVFVSLKCIGNGVIVFSAQIDVPAAFAIAVLSKAFQRCRLVVLALSALELLLGGTRVVMSFKLPVFQRLQRPHDSKPNGKGSGRDQPEPPPPIQSLQSACHWGVPHTRPLASLYATETVKPSRSDRR